MATVQFAVLPNFSNFSFPDNAPVQAALDQVLQLRKRKDNTEKILNTIVSSTGSQTVGELRRLSDQEWKSLDVPAMCRIYLKYLVRQALRQGPLSSSPTSPSSSSPSSSSSIQRPAPSSNTPVDPFLTSLQNDFNYGQPFDMNIYSSNLSVLRSMGFGHLDALEALVITENKGAESALELLVKEPAAKKKIRQEQVEKQGKSFSAVGGSMSVQASNVNILLATELSSLKQQLERERSIRLKTESEMKNHIDSLPRVVYKEMLRSIISDDSHHPLQFEQLRQYRDRYKITLVSHGHTLQELGLTVESFDTLSKKSIEAFAKKKGEIEPDCVICLAKPKSHVILNCMHVCLCEDCVDTLDKKSPKCPICSNKVSSVKRVYL